MVNTRYTLFSLVSVTSHLLEACAHPHTRMREWAAEAVCVLIQASLRHSHEPALAASPRLQTLLLSPLVELSAIPHPDIRSVDIMPSSVLQAPVHSFLIFCKFIRL